MGNARACFVGRPVRSYLKNRVRSSIDRKTARGWIVHERFVRNERVVLRNELIGIRKKETIRSSYFMRSGSTDRDMNVGDSKQFISISTANRMPSLYFYTAVKSISLVIHVTRPCLCFLQSQNKTSYIACFRGSKRSSMPFQNFQSTIN